jgi:hypothetical protein
MATPPPAKQPLDAKVIGELIRRWVYYDNQIGALNKQIREIRENRQTYEKDILGKLMNSTMANPVIQIGDGRIVVGQDRSQQPLSYTMLETILTKYYSLRPGSKNETKDIVNFIREQRTSQLTPCLKRITNPTSRRRRDSITDQV